MPITLPFNPAGMEFQGAVPNIGALQQLISTLAANGQWGLSVPTHATVALTTGLLVTVPQHLAQQFTYTGAGGNLSNAWNTAANIVAAIPNPYIGMEWPWLVINNTNGTLTNVAGVGFTTTLAPTLTIPTLAMRQFYMTITACPVKITGISYANGVVAVTTNSPHGLAAGGTAVVANLVNSAFNGSFTVASSPSVTSTTFSYPLAAATAFATDSTVPNPSPQRPGLLNTPAAISASSDWALVTAITSA